MGPSRPQGNSQHWQFHTLGGNSQYQCWLFKRLAVLSPEVQQVPVKQSALAVSHPEDTRRLPALAVNPGGVQHSLQGSNPLQHLHSPALPLERQGTALHPPLDMPNLAATQEMLRLSEGQHTKAIRVPMPQSCAVSVDLLRRAVEGQLALLGNSVEFPPAGNPPGGTSQVSSGVSPSGNSLGSTEK